MKKIRSRSRSVSRSKSRSRSQQRSKQVKKQKAKLSNFIGGNESCIFENVKIVERPAKEKNIVSVAFFTLPNAYKPISAYSEGIFTLLDYMEKNNSKYLLRIYYDATVENNSAIKRAMDSNYAELIKCDCSKLIDLKHQNLLTVIMRYLPFFDETVNYAFVVDTDFAYMRQEAAVSYPPFLFQTYDKVIATKTNLLFENWLCYRPKWHDIYFSQPTPVTLGGFIVSNIKQPMNMLLKYINAFITKDDPIVVKFIKLFQKPPPDIKLNIGNMYCTETSCSFTYGFDEVFLTLYYIPACLASDHKIQLKERNPIGNIKYILRQLMPQTHKLDNFVKQFLLKQIPRFKAIRNTDAFIKTFTTHDYEDKDKPLQKLYLDFRKYVMDHINEIKHLLDMKQYQCLVENDRYFTDVNNTRVLSEDEKKIKISNVRNNRY